MMRIFFAIRFTIEIQQQIEMVLKKLQQLLPDPTIRWTKPENLHITLQFIPNLQEKDLLSLCQLVRKISFSTFELNLGKLELFPNTHHPRVISLDVEPHEQLLFLSQEIGKKIEKIGYETEKRAFNAHVTLARIQRAVSLSTIEVPAFKTIKVKEVVLYQSERDLQGSRYIPLEVFKAI